MLTKYLLMYMHMIMKGILEMRKFGLVHVRVIVSVKSKLSRDTFISSISFCACSPILGGSGKCSGGRKREPSSLDEDGSGCEELGDDVSDECSVSEISDDDDDEEIVMT